jgi:subtilisin
MAKLLLAVLLALSPLAASAQHNVKAGVEDRLIVAFKPAVPVAARLKVLADHGLTVLDEIPAMRTYLVKAPAGKAVVALGLLTSRLEVQLAGHDEWRQWIESAPTFQGTPLPSLEAVMPTLPKLELAPAASRTAPVTANAEAPWGVARVNAPAAWSSVQGSGVKVAVIDTGIAPDHPDVRVAGGYNALDKQQPWHDDHSHGTHVSGSIAALLDGKGVAGVAPQASLYAVKVLSKDGGGNLFAIMDGIMWTGNNGMQVANMSLGAAQEMPLLQYALQMARNAGVTLIAAAGNDGKAVNYPAAYPECVAVSALCPTGITEPKLCPNTSEGISTFSSRGPQVAFIAPGVRIPSTVPIFADASGYKAYSGTSMASPHVAGLAALAVARGAKGPDAVAAALRNAASPLPGLSASEQGAGLIDAARIR